MRLFRPVLFAALILSASPAAAQVVRVVDDDGMGSGAGCDGSTPAFTTPGAAIAAARNGDTVLVCPGRYVGNLDFGGKAITLRSAGGPSVTTLDGGGSGSVVTFQSGEGRSSVLEGFTIRNGRGYSGGGVAAYDASPIIRGNIIVDNNAEYAPGGGIYGNGGAPLIEENRINRNSAGSGGGICLSQSDGAVIRRNVITDNFSNSLGGGIDLSGRSISVHFNLVSGNRAMYGGGLNVGGLGNEILGNVAFGNWVSNYARAINLEYGRGTRLINNTIAENGSTGLVVDTTTCALVANNIIVASLGDPVYCDGFSADTLIFRSNNVFSTGGAPGSCAGHIGVNGNIWGDPLFVDPTTGDFHLQPGSPSLDAGDGTAASGLAIDFDGHARVLDADGDGLEVIDMGADEAESAASGSPPGAFGKTAPANAAYGVLTTPRLSWAPSSGATGYEYCHDTVDNGACDGTWLPAWGASGAVPADLDSMTMYHWQVRARNAAGVTYAEGRHDMSWRFATTLAVPRSFRKLAPGNYSRLEATGELRWSVAAGAERYEYCIRGSGNGLCAVWVSTGSRTSVRLDGLASGNYDWQVRAVNAAGATYADWNTYWVFSVASAPSAFALTAPANGVRDVPTTAALSWQGYAGVAYYRYCIDTIDNDSCDTAWIDAGTSTSVTVSGLRRATTYYWMVEAVNVAGTTRATGGSWSFTTGSARVHPASPPRGGSGTTPRPSPRIRPGVGP